MESATRGVKRIHCGDSVLPIRLSGLNGSEVNLYHPRFAGSSIVLWLTEESPATATLRAVARRHQQFGAVEARLFNLVSGVDAPAEKTKEVRGLTRMFDPERRLLAAFGLAGAGIAVVGPDLRLAGVLEGEDFDAAFRLCQALHARTERTVLTAQAPVLFVPDVLDAETCLALVDYWHAGEKRADKVTSDSVGGERSDATIKKRQDVILLDEDLIALVKKRISERVVPELIKAFHFRAASLELLRIGCYDSAERGRFVRHRDNTDPYSAHRRFAMSLNLNDDAFEGGQV